MTDHPTADHDERLARLREARGQLRRARLRAAERVDLAHRDSLRALDELTALRDDPDRLWLLRQRARLRRVCSALRHPVRAVRSLGQRLVIALRLHRLGPALEHMTYSATVLRGLSPVSRQTDQPSPDEAIRWLGGVAVQGVTRHALFAHPTSTITWRMALPQPAKLAISCALVPAVARDNPDGVIVSVTARPVTGTQAWTASRHLRPRVVPADRFWRTVTLDLPAVTDGDLDIAISTTLPPGGSPDHAWALLGEPRLLRRRTPGEMGRLFRAILRRDGWKGVFARAAAGNATADLTADYRRWLKTYAPTPADLDRLRTEVDTWRDAPTFSVIVPLFNTDPAGLRACVDSVLAQVYPHWQLCLVDDGSTREETRTALDAYRGRDGRLTFVRLDTNGHISRASNAALDVATGEYVALLDHDDVLAPDALAEVARALLADPALDFVYTDEDKLDEAGGRCDPYFKPDWAPEHFLNFMYTNHLMALRRRLVEEAGRFRIGYEGSQDFDLALRIIERTQRIGHVPKVLYHWRKTAGSTASGGEAKPWALDAARRALRDHLARTEPDSQVLDGAAPGLFRVKRPIRDTPLVTLVVTTDDRSREVNGRAVALLPHVVDSIVRRTAYSRYELLIIDNGRLSDHSRDVLAKVPHRRVSYTIEGTFNFAHKLNFSMRHAAGEYAVILNDDLEVISSEWLTALLEYAQDPQVGAVGARLLYPDGRLQHVGMLLGVCGVAAHAFHQAPGHHPGYFGSARGPRNYSAVTGACLMTRTALFREMGGFNERLAIDFNDVDYCLRLRRAGYRIVYTPYAELYHLEAGTISGRTWDPAEVAYMKETWADVLARDPYYNPNLSREYPDYRLP